MCTVGVLAVPVRRLLVQGDHCQPVVPGCTRLVPVRTFVGLAWLVGKRVDKFVAVQVST